MKNDKITMELWKFESVDLIAVAVLVLIVYKMVN